MTARERARLENINTYGSKLAKRRWKTIIAEIGAAGIAPSLRDDENVARLLRMCEDPDKALSYDDLVIFGQYDEAIFNRSVRSAEFLRDTRGDKPTNQVEVTDKTPLRGLSTEDLLVLLEHAKQCSIPTDGEGDEPNDGEPVCPATE